ncbi:ATP-binding cassette domain-containing protein [Kordiimonas sp. SCSIO 12610]|uniref:ATP-binding cassette domain-containing protein n=1 Tax=Kordiimonas sp. SCSIO 12610 TaxID=2829597 RepID=UPI002108E9F5|nr:ATP-binding cassette domain-containing protein [Kordiimonas sp. SCSIO 12610]UTW54569.1 ATP-binding cassette domain-containing protein [Kordiimonas sp. SCSIO 12610]
MAPPILSLRNINLSWGADPILSDLEMHIGDNDRLCLLGRNGTGKSTLLKIIAGLIEADDGERWVKPGAKVAYLPQEPDASAYKTLFDYILGGLPEDEADQAYRVDVLVDDLAIKADASPESASGGELRRAALARTLIGEPDLLLLDEPTNHLDITIIEWLENYLRNWRGAMMLISHDRAFLESLTKACLWLDRGQVRRLDDGFQRFEAWQEEVLEEEKMQAKKLDKLIKEETRWSVEGISARRTRNQGRLRRLYALRQERANQIEVKGSVSISVGEGGKSGARVIEAKNISKAYDGRTLFKEFDLKIARGDRIGIIGPNGVGKSTLLKALTGVIEPDTGTVKLGTNLDILSIDQSRSDLKETMTVSEVLAGGSDWVEINGERKHVRSYMKDFLFDASQANTPVSALSGGERNRLLLAANFAKPSNFLILDEPTNDLDMDTLDLLQEVLADYQGTILLVSHDRDFLDRVVTSSIVMEGDGSAIEYAGGYSDYKTQKKAGERGKIVDTTAKKAQVSNVTSIAKAIKKKSNKLSYKDQRELDSLPAEVEALSMKISDMEAELSDPDLYTKNPAHFNALSKDIEAKRDELDAKELRWLELEELKESLNN